MKRTLSILLCIILLLGMLPAGAMAVESPGFDGFAARNTYEEGRFSDVSPDKWFYENVVSAYQLGLMIGRSGTRFDAEG